MEKEIGYKDNNAFYEIYKLLMKMGNKFKVLIQQKGIKTKSIKECSLPRIILDKLIFLKKVYIFYCSLLNPKQEKYLNTQGKEHN